MDFSKVKKIFKRKRAIEILQLLHTSGELNFKTIDQKIESSSETISTTLKILTDHRLVNRVQHSVNDVRYSLTKTGKETLNLIKELNNTIEKEK